MVEKGNSFLSLTKLGIVSFDTFFLITLTGSGFSDLRFWLVEDVTNELEDEIPES